MYILLNCVLITNFQNEANLFKNFFVQQCSVSRNDNALLNTKYMIVVSITEDKIVCIIWKLNSSKVHRYDKMSIRLLKVCNAAIAGALKCFYEKWMDTGRYPRLWKKAIIVPEHRKNSGKILKITSPFRFFQPVARLSKVIFDEIYAKSFFLTKIRHSSW